MMQSVHSTVQIVPEEFLQAELLQNPQKNYFFFSQYLISFTLKGNIHLDCDISVPKI
jgi:hypothetical protein